MNKYTRKIIQKYVENAPEARELLDEEEWHMIKEKGQQNYLRNYFFEPSHKRPRKTYRIQLIIDSQFSLLQFLTDITEFLNGEFDLAIDCGYTALKATDHESLRFIFPAKCNAFISATVTNEKELDQMIEKVKEADKDILLNAFLSHQKEYSESGFVPRTAICLDTYLTTF